MRIHIFIITFIFLAFSSIEVHAQRRMSKRAKRAMTINTSSETKDSLKINENSPKLSKDINTESDTITFSSRPETTDLETTDEQGIINVALALINSKKFDKAYEILLPLAEANPVAAFWIGRLNLEGLGIEQDKEKGIEYLIRASELGMPLADLYLGKAYYNGNGVNQNSSLAVKFFKRAAERGNPEGQFLYARELATGKYTAQNFNLALAYFERSAGNGYIKDVAQFINDSIPTTPFATYVRGIKLYNAGAYNHAMKQFKKLEKYAKDDAFAWQGKLYTFQPYSDYDLKKGISLIKQSAKLGNAMALYELGLFTMEGIGVKRDLKKGMNYLTQSAQAGCPQAMLTLGNLYFTGKVVEKNYPLSAEYYEQASKLSPLGDARKRYAAIYRQGLGDVNKDEKRANSILSTKDNDNLSSLLKLIIVTD